MKWLNLPFELNLFDDDKALKTRIHQVPRSQNRNYVRFSTSGILNCCELLGESATNKIRHVLRYLND